MPMAHRQKSEDSFLESVLSFQSSLFQGLNSGFRLGQQAPLAVKSSPQSLTCYLACTNEQVPSVPYIQKAKNDK